MIPPIYDKETFSMLDDYSSGFSENLAPVKLNGYWGYIDLTGRFEISPRFRSAAGFVNEKAIVEDEHSLAFINKKGKIISRISSQIKIDQC